MTTSDPLHPTDLPAGEIFTPDELRAYVRMLIGDHHGAVSQWCQANNVARFGLAHFLSGRRSAPADVLHALGLQQAELYVRVDQ